MWQHWNGRSFKKLVPHGWINESKFPVGLSSPGILPQWFISVHNLISCLEATELTVFYVVHRGMDAGLCNHVQNTVTILLLLLGKHKLVINLHQFYWQEMSVILTYILYGFWDWLLSECGCFNSCFIYIKRFIVECICMRVCIYHVHTHTYTAAQSLIVMG